MWTYRQATGELIDGLGVVAGTGYSGVSEGKNNPAMQSVRNVGPIPKGQYSIQPPQDTVTHGLFVLPLMPFGGNEMFGRSGFLIHGDSVVDPGTASTGCIIMPRAVREALWGSNDHLLLVTA